MSRLARVTAKVSHQHTNAHTACTDSISPAENYALVSPDRDWQDRLQSLLQASAPQTRIAQPASYSQPPSATYALPPFRQLSSPVHHSSQQQHTQYSLQGNLGGYSTPTKHESPVTTAAMLAPLQQPQSQNQQSGYTTATATTQQPQNDSPAYVASRWDGFNGYSRIPGMWFVAPPPSHDTPTDFVLASFSDDVLRDDQDSKRSAYELGPSPHHHQPQSHAGVREAYQAAVPRCGSAATAYVSSPLGSDGEQGVNDAHYSDPSRWFFGSDTAVS